MKFYLCYFTKDRTQTQNVDITINFTSSIVFLDDQNPSSGSISVFVFTKYNIDSVFSLYHITIYITILIYYGSTNLFFRKVPVACLAMDAVTH